MANPDCIDSPILTQPHTVRIPLTKGYFAVVDACDADLLQYRWYALTSKKRRGVYAQRKDYANNTLIYMHREILSRMVGRELGRLDFTDHIDHDGTNNRRDNLRLATPSQNAHNSLRNRSGLRGVCQTSLHVWTATIQVKTEVIRLGYFPTAEQAHEAYKIALVKHHGEFATNDLGDTVELRVEAKRIAFDGSVFGPLIRSHRGSKTQRRAMKDMGIKFCISMYSRLERGHINYLRRDWFEAICRWLDRDPAEFTTDLYLFRRDAGPVQS
jgi:hypothetical protein